MAAAQAVARQPELFTDPLEPRTLPSGGWPFWTLNTLNKGKMHQCPYRLHQMEWVLEHVRQDVDTYMSQAFFSKPCRRALHVTWLTHAYVDLDLYKLPLPPNPGEAGILLRMFCNDEGIPEPSLIVFSGRGVYLKWMWSNPLPRAAAGRAVAVNRALVKRFRAWGADPAAVDVSRVLRVVGTTNTRSGQAARVLWQAERDGQVLTYNFDMFADEVLPYTLEQVRSFRIAADVRKAEVHILSQERERRRAQREAERARKGGQRPFVPEDWHWGVVEDLRTLTRLRSADGLVQPGSLDMFGHIGACQLARVVTAGQLWHEIQAWARIILPMDYAGSEAFARHSSTLLRRAQSAAGSEKATYRGRQVTPVYTYRKQTIIERLAITNQEMAHLTRLIDDGEKRHRDRKAWQASHTGQTRAEYEAQARTRRIRVMALREQGLTWRAIGIEVGVHESEARRLMKADA